MAAGLHGGAALCSVTDKGLHRRDAARRAFDERRWLNASPSERGRILWRIADLVERNLEELAELESIDNGKPYAVARVADLQLAVDMFRYMGGWATKITGTTLPLSLPGKYLSYTVREPVGVVRQIIPWNFPLLIPGVQACYLPPASREHPVAVAFAPRAMQSSDGVARSGLEVCCHPAANRQLNT